MRKPYWTYEIKGGYKTTSDLGEPGVSPHKKNKKKSSEETNEMK